MMERHFRRTCHFGQTKDAAATLLPLRADAAAGYREDDAGAIDVSTACEAGPHAAEPHLRARARCHNRQQAWRMRMPDGGLLLRCATRSAVQGLIFIISDAGPQRQRELAALSRPHMRGCAITLPTGARHASSAASAIFIQRILCH